MCIRDRIYTSLPGQGAFDFADLSKKLKEKNFQGAVTMEVYPDDWEKDEALKRAYEYLKTIFEWEIQLYLLITIRTWYNIRNQ